MSQAVIVDDGRLGLATMRIGFGRGIATLIERL